MKIFISIILISVFFGHAFGADDQIKKECPMGIINAEEGLYKKVLTDHGKTDRGYLYEEYTMVRIDVTGKCFKIPSGKFYYLIDEKHAIYRVSTVCNTNPLFLFEFTNSTVKNRRFEGIIKCIGFFQYKDAEGISRTIPRAIVLQERKWQ